MRHRKYAVVAGRAAGAGVGGLGGVAGFMRSFIGFSKSASWGSQEDVANDSYNKERNADVFA